MRESRLVDETNDRYGGLSKLAESITTSLRDETLVANPRVALFRQELQFIDEELRSADDNREVVRAFLQVGTFADHFNLKWSTIQKTTEVRQ